MTILHWSRFDVDTQIGVHEMKIFLVAVVLLVLIVIAGRDLEPEPELVFNWHGYRAGLDKIGRRPPRGFAGFAGGEDYACGCAAGPHGGFRAS